MMPLPTNYLREKLLSFSVIIKTAPYLKKKVRVDILCTSDWPTAWTTEALRKMSLLFTSLV